MRRPGSEKLVKQGILQLYSGQHRVHSLVRRAWDGPCGTGFAGHEKILKACQRLWLSYTKMTSVIYRFTIWPQEHLSAGLQALTKQRNN